MQKYNFLFTFVTKMEVNMKNLWILARHYPFTTACVIIIWVLCLMPIPETPLSHVRLIDKWTHLVMYGGLCTVIWAEQLRNNRRVAWPRAIVGAIVLPVLMGGLIEIVQAYCTGGRRSGDWMDFAADSIGVAIGTVIGILLAACLARYRRGNAAG